MNNTNSILNILTSCSPSTSKNPVDIKSQMNVGEFTGILNRIHSGNTEVLDGQVVNSDNLFDINNFICDDGELVDLNTISTIDISEDSSNELCNLLRKISDILNDCPEIAKDVFDLIKENTTLDEFEESMSVLAAQFNIIFEPIKILSGQIVENNDISSIKELSNEQIVDTFISSMEHTLDINSDAKLSDISEILDKLKSFLTTKGESLSINNNKKKDIHTNIDNFNINMAHSKAITLNNITSVDEVNLKSNPLIKNIVNVISEKISNMDVGAKTLEVRLKLYPANLGNIVVDVSTVNGKINLKIATESENVKALLTESIRELVNSLDGKNISIGDVNISTLSSSNNGAMSNGSNNNGYSNKQFNNVGAHNLDIDDESLNSKIIKEASYSREIDVSI